jgi:hypothetical protein
MAQSIELQQAQMRKTFEILKAALSTKYIQEVDSVRLATLAESQVFRDQVADLKARLQSVEKTEATSRAILTSQTLASQMAQDAELRRIRTIRMKELQVTTSAICTRLLYILFFHRVFLESLDSGCD